MMETEKDLYDESMRGRRPRMAVFGGSFNPVHNGHLLLAGDIIRQGVVDEVLFVPARVPPHKRDMDILPGAVRMEMLTLAIEPYSQFSVSDIELGNQCKSGYTFDTMAALSRAFVDVELSFLIGMDSLLDIHSWFKASELIGRYRIITYPRPGYPQPNAADLATRMGPRNASKLLAAIVDAPSVAISSTGVRETAARGLSLAGLVPPKVEALIAEQKLYLSRG